MDAYDVLINVIGITTILGQAFADSRRHFVMTVGASACLLLVWLKTGTVVTLLSGIPLDVMLILVGLTLFGDFILKSNLFGVLIRRLAVICQGRLGLIYILFSVLIFLISSLLNNYQAVLLLTPALIGILSQLEGVKKYYINLLFGTVIILSNLGGASLPISDFPALVMFSKGIISFQSYVPNATPLVLTATVIVIVLGCFMIKKKEGKSRAEGSPLSAAITAALYRGVRIDKPKLWWSVVIFGLMMVCWIMGIDPTVVTVIGLSVLAIVVEKGKFLEGRIRSLEPSIFVFYLALFTVIASIQSTPLLGIIADWVSSYQENRLVLIVIFSATTMIVTSIVSAGPSTVALLPVALDISKLYPDNMVITCFALSICAGSSIFTFSATAGPLVQSLSEKYQFKVEEEPLRFGFREYLLPGILGGLIIFTVTLVYILLKV